MSRRIFKWTDAAIDAIRQMAEAGNTCKDAAYKLNTSQESVKKAAARHGISMKTGNNEKYNKPRPDTNSIAMRPCLSCGKLFKSKWIGNRLCGCSGKSY